MKRVWTEEKDELLAQLYPTAHLGNLAFRLRVTVKALRSRAKVLKLKRERKYQVWNVRQTAYLRKHYADTPIDVLMEVTKHSQKSIWNKAKKMGLRKSLEFLQEVGRQCSKHPKSIASRFVKGSEPANKGKRIEEFMSEDGIKASSRTRFKSGRMPHNTLAIGTERVYADGYVWIKVNERKRVQKHRYVWEQAHGKIPDGYLVAFRDGNRQNCDLSNLYLISRQESARRCINSESAEARQARVTKAQATRNKSIRRDKIRLHYGMEPIGNLVKRW